MPSWFMQQASSFAPDVDNLILLITVIVGVWFVAAEAIFFWLIWKFRARDGVKAEDGVVLGACIVIRIRGRHREGVRAF